MLSNDQMVLSEFLLYFYFKERTGVCEVIGLNTCSPPHIKLVIGRQISQDRIITCS